MSRLAFKPRTRFASLAAASSLAFALSLTVSHQAMAACTTDSVGNDDAVTCSDSNPGAISTGTGIDTITVTGGAIIGTAFTPGSGPNVTIIDAGTGGDTINFDGGEVYGRTQAGDDGDSFFIRGGTINGRVQGGLGNDTFIMTGGTLNGDTTATNGHLVGGDGNDFIFVGGGTVNGEIQGGAGTDLVALFGGTTGKAETGSGTGDTIYIDGAVVGGAEINDGASGHTFYLRSGSVGEVEAEAVTNDTFIIDPINSKVASAFEGITSIDEFNAALATAATNTDALMIFRADEFETGQGDDTVTFVGAVNDGSSDANVEFAHVNGLGFDGGTQLADGADTLNVTNGSNLVLGEVENFEVLNVLGGVRGGSILTLTEEDEEEGDEEVPAYTFSEAVTVDGTSVLSFTAEEVTLVTDDFTLESGTGITARLAGLPDYYQTFATGGILQIGDAAEEDEEEVVALEEEEDEDEDEDEDDEEGGEPAKQTELKIVVTSDSTYHNNGTINMLNGTPGGELSIVGPYVSSGGNLAIDTELSDSESETDKLEIDGSVTGTTVIYVNNVGGKGAFTGQGEDDGIEIVENESDTEEFEDEHFELAPNALTGRREVIGGAFSYRLKVTEDAALLQSDILDQVPAYVTAPSVGQRLVSAGLDTLYKRLGEIRQGNNGGATSANGLFWVRGNYSDYDVDAKEGFDFSQKSRAFLAGAGVNIASDGPAKLDVGVFGGYGSADADVAATIFGAASASSVDVEGWSAGGYITYYELGRPGTGLYLDGVVKADFLDFEMAAATRAASGSTDGESLTASAEIGYGLGLGGGLVVQPQAQIAYTDLSMNAFKDAAPYGLAVSYGVAESLIGRLGVQLQANLVQPGGGSIAPYAIFNVLSEFEGANESEVAGTDFKSDVGGTWYSAGGGVTAELASNLSVYGSGEYSFGDVEGWQGTGGVKLHW